MLGHDDSAVEPRPFVGPHLCVVNVLNLVHLVTDWKSNS
ncbi:hypothetical protein RCH23_001825 [Cryobacterium sp. CAN_C3]|nr:hypothetical protein [Cryobacterium sp. CAN_C3]